MFELSVAFKYLIPRWRQLSVSIISIISILVISLVVWLVVVFFSVTNGLEKTWTQKLIALTAPIRILPTEAYYNSYYYQIDSISAASDYAYKSIAEKLNSPTTDPYDETSDEEVPSTWLAPDRNPDGSTKDIVKKTFEVISSLKGIPGLSAKDFEVTFANLRLRLLRDDAATAGSNLQNQSSLSHAIWLASFDTDNPSIEQALLPIRMEDLQNVLDLLPISTENIREDTPEGNTRVDKATFQNKLNAFFDNVTIKQLKTPSSGWILPRALLPKEGVLHACAVTKGKIISRLVLPRVSNKIHQLQQDLEAAGFQVSQVEVKFEETKITATLDGESRTLSKAVPFVIQGGLLLDATVNPESLKTARQPSDLKFAIQFTLDQLPIQGIVTMGKLEIADAVVQSNFATDPEIAPLWLYQVKESTHLGNESSVGEGILLPRSFKDAGVLIGDRGYLSYYTPTASSFQEQRIPIYTTGFYDPGIIPIGGKLVLASKEMTTLMRAAYQQEDKSMGTGINVRFKNIDQADQVKADLKKAFQQEGLSKYWTIETFREFEFTKDIIQQLRSEKNLFTVLAAVIIIVACSNIISMLIILVNDKKLEIGILRSMGATSASIATIFGACGVVMGLMGSLIGTLAAVVTLKNLPTLIQLVSHLQGYEMFNTNFYGKTMPHELSYEALTFVCISTVITSLLAGIVPAVKASMLKPSSILKAE